MMKPGKARRQRVANGWRSIGRHGIAGDVVRCRFHVRPVGTARAGALPRQHFFKTVPVWNGCHLEVATRMLEPIASSVPAAAPLARHHSGFHILLSELNPLQYLPVIGTIYRAVTGDTIPDRARLVGGFVASGLIGGPIGLAWDAAEVVVEKAIGVDPEKIGQTMLAKLGFGAAPTSGLDAAATAPALPTPRSDQAARGALSGAEALNESELEHLATQHGFTRAT